MWAKNYAVQLCDCNRVLYDRFWKGIKRGEMLRELLNFVIVIKTECGAKKWSIWLSILFVFCIFSNIQFCCFCIGKVLKQSKTNKKLYHLKLKLLVNFNAFKNNKTVTINEQQNDSWKNTSLCSNLIMMISPFNSAPRFSIHFFPVSNDALIKFYFIICHLVMKWNNLTQFSPPFFAATVIACLFFWSTPVNDLIWSDRIGSDRMFSLTHSIII